MTTPEVRMTREEWRSLLDIAASVWNAGSFFDDSEGRPTQTAVWYAALCRFEAGDVMTALGRLALAMKFWPKLAEVVEATRAAVRDRLALERKNAQDNVLRLPPTRHRTVDEQQRSFDQAAADWRCEAEAELQQYANRHQQQGCELDVREQLTELDEEGPYARRARELVAGNVTPGVGLDTMLRGFAREQPLACGPHQMVDPVGGPSDPERRSAG